MSFLHRLFAMLRGLVPGGGGRPLCDTCKYDYGDACVRKERPNALRCSDYRKR